VPSPVDRELIGGEIRMFGGTIHFWMLNWQLKEH